MRDAQARGATFADTQKLQETIGDIDRQRYHNQLDGRAAQGALQEARVNNFVSGFLAEGDRVQNEVSKFNQAISDYRDKIKQAFGGLLVEKRVDFQDVKQLDKLNAFRVGAPGNRNEPNGHDLLQIDQQKVRDTFRAFINAKKEADALGDRIARANAVQQEVIKSFNPVAPPVGVAGGAPPAAAAPPRVVGGGMVERPGTATPLDRSVGGGMMERGGTGTPGTSPDRGVGAGMVEREAMPTDIPLKIIGHAGPWGAVPIFATPQTPEQARALIKSEQELQQAKAQAQVAAANSIKLMKDLGFEGSYSDNGRFEIKVANSYFANSVAQAVDQMRPTWEAQAKERRQAAEQKIAANQNFIAMVETVQRFAGPAAAAQVVKAVSDAKPAGGPTPELAQEALRIFSPYLSSNSSTVRPDNTSGESRTSGSSPNAGTIGVGDQPLQLVGFTTGPYGLLVPVLSSPSREKAQQNKASSQTGTQVVIGEQTGDSKAGDKKKNDGSSISVYIEGKPSQRDSNRKDEGSSRQQTARQTDQPQQQQRQQSQQQGGGTTVKPAEEPTRTAPPTDTLRDVGSQQPDTGRNPLVPKDDFVVAKKAQSSGTAGIARKPDDKLRWTNTTRPNQTGQGNSVQAKSDIPDKAVGPSLLTEKPATRSSSDDPPPGGKTIGNSEIDPRLEFAAWVTDQLKAAVKDDSIFRHQGSAGGRSGDSRPNRP